MKNLAIILSGGKGTRFGSDLPKQYIDLCGKPVLAHTILAFERSRVDEVVIVAAPEYLDVCREMAQRYDCRKVSAVIAGGAERYDSVLQGIRYFHSIYGCGMQVESGLSSAQLHLENAESSGQDWKVLAQSQAVLLIHDGARPCIQPEVINRIADATRQYGACIAGTPCTDTIKIVDSEGCIIDTTDRKFTWAAQTPQAFYLEEICHAYEAVIGDGGLDKKQSYFPKQAAQQAEFKPASGSDISGNTGSADGRKGITDDAIVYQMVYPDRKVHMADAGSNNIKITSASDLERAQGILKSYSL